MISIDLIYADVELSTRNSRALRYLADRRRARRQHRLAEIIGGCIALGPAAYALATLLWT